MANQIENLNNFLKAVYNEWKIIKEKSPHFYLSYFRFLGGRIQDLQQDNIIESEYVKDWSNR